MKYLEDSGKNFGESWKDVPQWANGNLPGLAGAEFGRGQGEADRNKPNYRGMTNEDLYRVQSETTAPSDNPFLADQRERSFDPAYADRHRPRVYATDNSFVYPNTEPVHQNTALIPATAQPAVVGSPATAPMSTAPQFTPEVTAQTATPGYMGVAPQQETAAAQFAIKQPRRSAIQVR